MQETISKSLNLLKDYCEREQFKGWDPYDGLNSRVFQGTFLRNSRFARLAWIQLFKRNPVNIRPFAYVKKEYNPKGLALFLTGYCNLFAAGNRATYLKTIEWLSNKLIDLQSSGYSGSCWGYNFDWQARAFFQPRYTPTVVASTFAVYALLDAFEVLKDNRLKEAALSTADFIINDLNRTYDDDGDFAFSYSPLDQTQVFNATLLASRALSRIYAYTKEKRLKGAAQKSVAFCVKHQAANGSWTYSTLPYHQWIDSFHTGYNLECIAEYQRYTGDTQFQSAIDKGLQFYLTSFFTDAGESKYYHNSLYPIDIHAPAQLLVTLFRLNALQENKEMVHRVLNWTIHNMQDKEGYFYFQIKKYFNSKTPYMRWAQAWMFYALTFYLRNEYESH